MSRTTLGTLIGLQVFLISSSFAMNGNSKTYFPMHVGDKWYYDSPLPQSNPWAMKTVRDSMSIGNRTYYTWTYGDGVDAIDTLTSDSVGNIWKYVGGTEYLMFDFLRDNGTSYRYELGDRWGDSVYYYTVSVWTNVSATTPAGVFQHCIRFRFDEPQVKDEEVVYTFAPDVGLIIQQNDGWSIKKLTSAIVDGETVASLEESNHSPSIFQLGQNYPNPFNPSTTIRYALPSRAHVTLTVYNSLGQEVATMVNDVQDAGYHDVRFDASALASGVYFYRLRAGGFVETHRMVLLR